MKDNLAAANAIRQHNFTKKVLYFPVSWQKSAAPEEVDGVLMSDIPEAYRDLAEDLGMDAFLRLARLCSGQYLYIPKWESIRRNARDREIRALFNGGNYKALALQFDLSERQIYKIISGTRT